jgi:hypothetical protein
MSYLDFFRAHAGLNDGRTLSEGVFSEAKDFLDLSLPEPTPPTRWHAAHPVSPYTKIVSWFIKNPDESVLYVKDPKGLLRASNAAKAIADAMEGQYDAANTTDDFEIYADGSDGFGGYWAMQLHQEMTAAAEEYAKKHPFKFKVESVQGKTASGWKVTISYPTTTVREAEIDAMDALAAKLAAKGTFPDGAYNSHLHSFIPKGLYDKYLKMGQKKKVESVDVETYVRRVRDVSVRLEAAKTASPAEDVVKALNGVVTKTAGKMSHDAASSSEEHLYFDLSKGEVISGDDYDYMDDYEQNYFIPIKNEVKKLLVKKKIVGWDDVGATTGGYLVVSKGGRT